MRYKPGTELIVISDRYRSIGRRKGDTVIVDNRTPRREEWIPVILTGDSYNSGTEWEYQSNEVVPLTKLHKAMK